MHVGGLRCSSRRRAPVRSSSGSSSSHGRQRRIPAHLPQAPRDDPRRHRPDGMGVTTTTNRHRLPPSALGAAVAGPRPRPARAHLSGCTPACSIATARCGRRMWWRGSNDGRFAMYSKLHHSLIDGVSAMKLMQRMLSVDPDDREMRVTWSLPRRPRPKVGRRARRWARWSRRRDPLRDLPLRR